MRVAVFGMGNMGRAFAARALEKGHQVTVWNPTRTSALRATGPAGDVYLCHPFLIHAAQSHRGRVLRFIAQPPLDPVGLLELVRPTPRTQQSRSLSAGAFSKAPWAHDWQSEANQWHPGVCS